MESRNLNDVVHACRVLIFASCLTALFGCGGGGGGSDPNQGWTMPSKAVTIGPTGGEVSVTDSLSPLYGLRVVVPAGALTEDRSFEISEKFYLFRPYLPDGFTPYPSKEACFELIVSGNKPYGLGLQFYFPVKGMTLSTNEKACAFAYDRRVSKWVIVLPDTKDDNFMKVTADYRDYWMWGKVDTNIVDQEYLIGAVKEKFGAEADITTSVDEFQNDIKSLLQNLTCAVAKSWRDTIIPARKEALRQHMLLHQDQLGGCGKCNSLADLAGGVCYKCDVLSDQFRSQLLDYIGARIRIEFAELALGGPPTLITLLSGNYLELYLACAWIYAWDEIYALDCDYSCVHERVGVDFWLDYAKYNAYDILRLIIAVAIEKGLCK